MVLSRNMFFIISVLMLGFFKQTIQIEWMCNSPSNDLCYTYDKLNRLDDTVFQNETYRLVSLNKSERADVRLSSNSPVKIVLVGDDLHYISCTNKNPIKVNTSEPKEYDIYFEYCLKLHCSSKENRHFLKCDYTRNLHLKRIDDLECLKEIKRIVINGSENKTFELIDNNFFRNAPNLQDITIRAHLITLAPLTGLFGHLDNLRALNMPELEFTMLSKIIRGNPQLLFVQTKTNRAWNLCTKIELIDISTGIRSLEDFDDNNLVNILNQHTDTIANTYKGLEPKVKTFISSLTANEAALCIIVVICILIVLILFLGFCKR